ncbi:hypothetical protein [Novosphingobium malaysiense]|uniref:Secreted protein n=1 Tax=Novosphingobium malaysiense TaxID=1348853 RepID=A0A0B1ZUZ3_9SPHN|nr:hypothetical protein [Novosphingobium malaysiense]KHK92983.1 hypothetical protein LK12_00900 [Novosphingobium malaysiense]
MRILSGVVAATALVVSFPAIADPTAEADVKAKTAAADPAESEAKADPVICERIKEVGSLLRSKKVCMHKSEWEAQRRGDRSNIERSQVQRGLQPAG